jgi:hypothetical protein
VHGLAYGIRFFRESWEHSRKKPHEVNGFMVSFGLGLWGLNEELRSVA